MSRGVDVARSARAYALALALALLLLGCTSGLVSEPVTDGPTSARAAVVSAHPLATQAGVDILTAGGSAADAAVAVAAVLSVVEPWFSSALGGGTWALYYDADAGSVTSLDGVGPVGSQASPADFAPRAGVAGMHQSIVPGAWDGWMLWLERYGRLELGDVLAPAIAVAREGYAVSSQMSRWLEQQQAFFDDRPDTAAIYRPDGRLLRTGDTVRQEAMAATFEALVQAYEAERPSGRSAALQAARDHYYRGPIAEAVVAFSSTQPEHLRGYLTLDDFHGFQAAIVDPVHVDLPGGVRVYQNPPNSQGITMLIALQVLQGFDLSALGPDDPDAIHLQVEALKLAFEERHRFVGDPAPGCPAGGVDTATLLSESRAAALRERMALDRVLLWDEESDALVDGATLTSSVVGAAGDPFVTGTTTFHIVDRDGHAAAVTTSLGAQFYVVGDTGIHINNRMRFISVDEGDPNLLTPGCKVRHTSNPYLVTRDGAPWLLGGNTGADTQVQAQLQQLLHVLAFGLSASEAVARPRFLTTAFPSTTRVGQGEGYSVDNRLQLQSGFAAGVRTALELRGHTLVPPGESGTYGVAHMLELAPDGTVEDVATDPRYATSSGARIPD